MQCGVEKTTPLADVPAINAINFQILNMIISWSLSRKKKAKNEGLDPHLDFG